MTDCYIAFIVGSLVGTVTTIIYREIMDRWKNKTT